MVKARQAFKGLADAKVILGNDNHIGDIAEYWVRRYYELLGEFERYHKSKNVPFDIQLKDGTCVSVKTTTAWSKSGYGGPVRADSKDWQIFAAVLLDDHLYPEKLAILRVHQLAKKEVFVKNAAKRCRQENATNSYPRFTWWPWLDHYLVRFQMKDGDMELLQSSGTASNKQT